MEEDPRPPLWFEFLYQAIAEAEGRGHDVDGVMLQISKRDGFAAWLYRETDTTQENVGIPPGGVEVHENLADAAAEVLEAARALKPRGAVA